MEVVKSPETSVNTNQMTSSYIPEDSILQTAYQMALTPSGQCPAASFYGDDGEAAGFIITKKTY